MMKDTRAEFEALARTMPYDVTRNTTGRYKWYETQCAWEVWQHQAARIGELEAQVNELQREKKGMCLLPAKEWGELDYWLSRCENKGHLENCPDLIEPYNALYAAIAAHNIKPTP